jgi:hypothetical protein
LPTCVVRRVAVGHTACHLAVRASRAVIPRPGPEMGSNCRRSKGRESTNDIHRQPDCSGNSPPGDAGTANTVTGHATGQCSALA